MGRAPARDSGRDRGPLKDLLVVTRHARRSGPVEQVRTYGVARASAAAGAADSAVCPLWRGQARRGLRSIPGIELVEVLPSRGAGRALAYARAVLGGVPAQFARGISGELTSTAARLAAAPDRGRVIADGPIAAAALRGLARRRPVIYNAHNIESAFRGELAGEANPGACDASRRSAGPCAGVVDGQRAGSRAGSPAP